MMSNRNTTIFIIAIVLILAVGLISPVVHAESVPEAREFTVRIKPGGTITINSHVNITEEVFNRKLVQELLQTIFDPDIQARAKTLFAEGVQAFNPLKKGRAVPIEKFQEALIYVPDDSESKAYLHYNLGNAYFDEERWAEAELAYNESLKVLENRKWGSIQGHAYFKRALVLRHRTGDLQQALLDLQKAFNAFNVARYRPGQGFTLYTIGVINLEQESYDKALPCLQGAQQFFKRTRDSIGEGLALSTIGVLNYKQGKYPEALDYFKEALKIFGKTETGQEELDTLNYVGHIYYGMGKYSDAEYYHQKALKILQKIKDPSGEATTLGFIARAKEKRNEIEEAVKLMERVVEIDKAYDAPRLLTDSAYLEELRHKLKDSTAKKQ